MILANFDFWVEEDRGLFLACDTCAVEVLALLRDLLVVLAEVAYRSNGQKVFVSEVLRRAFSRQKGLDLPTSNEVVYCKAEYVDVCPSAESHSRSARCHAIDLNGRVAFH